MLSLQKLRLLAEVALTVACALLYAWGSRQAGRLAESESHSKTLESTVADTSAKLTQALTETKKDARTVVHIVTKPDGTKEVTETHEHLVVHETEHEQARVQEHSETHLQQETETRTSAPVGPDLSRYSLELAWSPLHLNPNREWEPQQATMGARLGNLPVWLTLGAERPNPQANAWTPTVGFRVEF